MGYLIKMRENQQSEPHSFIHMNPLSRNPGFATGVYINIQSIRVKMNDLKVLEAIMLGQIKKNLCSLFRVTRPYLNLLVKPRKKFQVFWKKYNFMPSKMHKIIKNIPEEKL